MKDPHEHHTVSAPGPTAILEAVAVTQRFGEALAVDGVSLAIAGGEIAGLIGPNGAGKTTLFDILAGDRRPTAGAVRLNGRAVERKPADARLAAGLGRTFQIPRPFGALTVAENVMLGRQGHPGERVWPNWLASARVQRAERETYERAMELLELVTLAPLAQEPARNLSGGQRKLLELARVLIAEPAIVLLDEPSAGVHPALLETIAARVAALNAAGMTFLIIEHNLELVARLCSHVYVMAAGRLLCEGTPSEVVRDARVIEAYVGGRAA